MCMKCIIDNAGLFESQRIHNLRFSATMWQKNDVSCHMIITVSAGYLIHNKAHRQTSNTLKRKRLEQNKQSMKKGL